jgi:hypothetical protein
MTPYPRHLGNRELLYRLDFRLFPHSRSSSIPVTLDFRQRFRLDEVTWTAKEELPLIASMHPSMRSADQAKPTRHGNRFFNVRPREFSLKQVLAWLSSVKDCEIAILPELTLPEPDALSASLRSAPADYPPLIVAGSAHASLITDEGRKIRVNESQVYLDGVRVHAHRKIHPLESRHFGTVELPHPLIEDITDDAGELIVLSGQHTRMAVVICADLNEQEIPRLLAAVGVNLLLVPVMTYSAGAFTGAVTSLASQCQAVCALANTDLRTSDARDPFLTLVAVPRATPFEQCRSYPARAEPRPPVVNGSAPRAVFDPNQPLPLEIQWL